jgi:hypothetical protein
MFKIVNKCRLWRQGLRLGPKYVEGTYAILFLESQSSMLLGGDTSAYQVMPVFYKTAEVAIRAVRRLQQLGDGNTYAVAVMPGDFIVSPEQ